MSDKNAREASEGEGGGRGGGIPWDHERSWSRELKRVGGDKWEKCTIQTVRHIFRSMQQPLCDRIGRILFRPRGMQANGSSVK